jgi:hypothetical protein
MRSFSATPANPDEPATIHSALRSFADECCGTLARLFVYVGALALFGIAGVHLWDQLPAVEAAEAPAKAGWSVATRSFPAFAVSQFDLPGKTEAYEILRHPEGGRKDIFRWAAEGERPVAELEIYRFGGESALSEPDVAEIAARIDPADARELEAAGVIDSKFGPVTLLRLAGKANDARSCLGFLKRFDEPGLRISGWSCQGGTLPARRAAVGCILNRLVLLTAGNERKLAETFAHAELKRGSCTPAPTSAPPVDWVTDAENPRLRSGI